MKLVKLSYKDANLELQDIELDSLNLIVAKNAIGKSRTTFTILLISKILSQKIDFRLIDVSVKVQFVHNSGYIFNYEFSTISGKFVKEILKVNDIEVLNRDSVSAMLTNEVTKIVNEVFPPENKLVLHTNRDTKSYPYFEDLIDWAENSYGFRFSNVIPRVKFEKFDFYSTIEDDVPSMLSKLPEANLQSIIRQFNSTGYNVSKILVSENEGVYFMYVYEENTETPIFHFHLSQGMYRDLSLIIFLEYLTSLKKPTLLIIDDLCEGLDYERARKLGELVFKKCEDSNIQLVATSNDSFLMDAVDIKYWNVLKRDGNVVTALNRKNHPKLFDDFGFTGLSNFDFFSSDYIKRKIQ